MSQFQITGGGTSGGGGGVTSFSGDGTLITNSGSTGAVTATLGNLPGPSMPTIFNGSGSGAFFCGWYGEAPPEVNATATTASGAFQVVMLTRLNFPHTVRKCSLYMTSTGTANAYLAIYNSAGTSRLLDTGAIANGSSASVKTATLGSPVSLNPGLYYVYIACEATVTVSTSNSVTGAHVFDLMGANFTRRASSSAAPSGGASPSSINGTLTNSTGNTNIPLCLFED